MESFHLCKPCRSAAVKFSPETARGRRHEKCREISGEILLFLFPQETKLESAQQFSRLISRHFSQDTLQVQMPNFMAFLTLRTFVLESFGLNFSESVLLGTFASISTWTSAGYPAQKLSPLKTPFHTN